MQGTITTIQRMSLHDGAGIRSTLFFKGCNFRCRWCHNPETWSFCTQFQYIASKCIGCGDCMKICPNDALEIADGTLKINRELCTRCYKCIGECPSGALSTIGRNVTPSEVVEELLADKLFYEESTGGVTISGGEPFTQPKFLLEVLKECKTKGLNIAIETNLCCQSHLIEEAAKYVDHWYVDIKSMNNALHREWVGCSNEQTIENLRLLRSIGAALTVRTPVVMGFNDNMSSIRAICHLLIELNITDYELLPFHKFGYDKFQQLGYQNPMNEDDELSEKVFLSLQKYVKKHLIINN